MKLTKFELIIIDIQNELIEAQNKHEKFPSYHHGYAVLKEEVDELWDEIKKKKQDNGKLYKEALQVATMAIRFIIDLDLYK